MEPIENRTRVIKTGPDEYVVNIDGEKVATLDREKANLIRAHLRAVAGRILLQEIVWPKGNEND